MPYILLARDGNEYGPVELETLVTWAEQGRVLPRSSIRITPEGETVLAHTIPELNLFDQPPKVVAPPVAEYVEYPRADGAQNPRPSKAGLVSITFWSVLSVSLTLFGYRYGSFMAFLGLMDMFQAWKRKDPYMTAIFTIGGIAIVVGIAGLILR
jgi:hypothetical protein